MEEGQRDRGKRAPTPVPRHSLLAAFSHLRSADAAFSVFLSRFINCLSRYGCVLQANIVNCFVSRVLLTATQSPRFNEMMNRLGTALPPSRPLLATPRHPCADSSLTISLRGGGYLLDSQQVPNIVIRIYVGQRLLKANSERPSALSTNQEVFNAGYVTRKEPLFEILRFQETTFHYIPIIFDNQSILFHRFDHFLQANYQLYACTMLMEYMSE
jgi:hypothetical protein